YFVFTKHATDTTFSLSCSYISYDQVLRFIVRRMMQFGICYENKAFNQLFTELVPLKLAKLKPADAIIRMSDQHVQQLMDCGFDANEEGQFGLFYVYELANSTVKLKEALAYNDVEEVMYP